MNFYINKQIQFFFFNLCYIELKALVCVSDKANKQKSLFKNFTVNQFLENSLKLYN